MFRSLLHWQAKAEAGTEIPAQIANVPGLTTKGLARIRGILFRDLPQMDWPGSASSGILFPVGPRVQASSPAERKKYLFRHFR